eukprot:GHVO01062347.1.p1 GENE.GHVO01062347.1~~GHVO01062347.1.p1  ORF type:complete len:165 (+),score=30.09 GHVO01062347.1:34-495(+)
MHEIVDHFDGHSPYGRLLQRRLDAIWRTRSMAKNEDRREKRGLADFVGEAAFYLFGTARKTDVDRLTKAVTALRTRTSDLMLLEQQRLAVIDVLNANQREIAHRLTQTVQRIAQQQTQMNQLGQVLEEEAHQLHHLEIRQRLALLISNLADDV